MTSSFRSVGDGDHRLTRVYAPARASHQENGRAVAVGGLRGHVVILPPDQGLFTPENAHLGPFKAC